MKADDERKREGGEGKMVRCDVLYWRWNWIFDLKMEKVFSSIAQHFFYVVSLSFGIYQLEQNLFETNFSAERKDEKKKKKAKMSSEKLLKLNEDLSTNMF